MTTYTIQEYINHLDSVINKLQDELATVFEVIWSKDMVSRIVLRVEEKRKNVDGSAFSEYNPKYLEWKQTKKGFQGSDKNFTLTREMWRGFDVVNKKRSPGAFEVALGGKTAESQIRINTNSKREGRSIIEASKGEEEAQNKFLEKWLFDFLSREL